VEFPVMTALVIVLVGLAAFLYVVKTIVGFGWRVTMRPHSFTGVDPYEGDLGGLVRRVRRR
jgi:hypothetical protein